jgi:hypothetical protein
MSYHDCEDQRHPAPRARLSRIARVLSTAAALGILGAAAVQGAEAWEILLTQQLKDQQRCTLALILNVNEVRVGDRVGLVGRIRCVDTREFDFQREQVNQRFEIKLCQPAVC